MVVYCIGRFREAVQGKELERIFREEGVIDEDEPEEEEEEEMEEKATAVDHDGNDGNIYFILSLLIYKCDCSVPCPLL
jgi:hypothetical protein